MTDVEIAIAAVDAGAEVVRRRFGANVRRHDKGAGDFATDADIEAEGEMLKVIREQRPEDRIVSEEAGITGPGAALRTWLVDINFDPPFENAPVFKATALAALPEFAARFRPRVVSSTMALTWVATGQRAAYITDGDVMQKGVHFAAGLAICLAAGCVVTNLWGEPAGTGATGLVACADHQTHATLMQLIRRIGA